MIVLLFIEKPVTGDSVLANAVKGFAVSRAAVAILPLTKNLLLLFILLRLGLVMRYKIVFSLLLYK